MATSPQSPKTPDNSVKLVEDSPDPFANAATPPTTSPSEGQSVTATDVSVSDTGTVEIHVNDANLVEVLRMLSMQSQRNIIASNQVNGHVTANLYGVTVREALDAILHANGYAYREQGNFIYVYTTKELADIEKSEKQLSTEVYRLFYTPAANAITMIKPVMSADGQVSSTTPAIVGIAEGGSDAGGDTHATEDMLVVTDYPENLEKIRKVVAEIDRRPQQILIEATILQAQLSEDNALGVDFQVLGGVDFSTITNSLGQITGADINSTSTAVGNKNVSSIGTGNSFSSGVPAGGLKLGIVSNNIAVFLSALESTTDTTILANPKVLAVNKQKGEVIVGRSDGYVTTTVTENANTQTVQFFDTGTKLFFRPFIGDDGYIRMEIHPEDSSGGVTAAGLPSKVTTEVTSNVIVKDNHTIVIGGLFRENSSTSRSQIPGLGNLPGAGVLFRQQRDTTSRQEVIILLTPHIIKDDDAYARSSQDEIKELEKMRIGVRKGMMPWGRERMAEAFYQTATDEMSKQHPDKSKALWFLDAATNLNPKYLEAINLKQDITGKVVTTSDNSSIRQFVTRQILEEKLNPPATQPMPHSVPITAATQPVTRVPGAPTSQPVVAMAPVAKPTTRPTLAGHTPKPVDLNEMPAKVTNTKSAAIDDDMDDQ
ncbi:MAG TPA: secretin and TonB N-terminal domain-containing protein [Tepidisphaeraceae bacterium]|nr:secretin and TonB N-terminal domain-containing protein [Tepidisphaeraceae bacterium]